MNFGVELRPQSPVTRPLDVMEVKVEDFAARRRRALQRVDKQLSNGNFKTAQSLVKRLQGKSGGLRGFGAAKQIPKSLSALEQLEFFDGVDLLSLRPLVDLVLDSIQSSLLDQDKIGGSEELMHGEGSNCKDDHFLCLQHEAGHFLVGYLLGALPKGYSIPSMEDLTHGNFSSGKVEFLGFEFLREVGVDLMLKSNMKRKGMVVKANRGKISSKILNQFSCIILGGLVAEHLEFGHSVGLHSDVEKLSNVTKWLGISGADANFQMRWATLNTVFILHRHHEARSRLVEAMASDKSVGQCISSIENAIEQKPI
ncbi:hypothetical protein K2173_017754 [Erythroxylum novogranatense]|uniref:Uncharacterized protein n=1 Tax=Erythroxylum novogranatense TaxID=1862640 RepID=A0AAV8T1Q8_9ROSI|nr:hypothetical protein K2173_017754 [Erythroxylum novogranatense]